MPLFFGSFMGGLWQGASSALSIYGGVKDMMAADAFESARQDALTGNMLNAQTTGAYQPPRYDEQGNYVSGAMPAGTTKGPIPGQTATATSTTGTGVDRLPSVVDKTPVKTEALAPPKPQDQDYFNKGFIAGRNAHLIQEAAAAGDAARGALPATQVTQSALPVARPAQAPMTSEGPPPQIPTARQPAATTYTPPPLDSYGVPVPATPGVPPPSPPSNTAPVPSYGAGVERPPPPKPISPPGQSPTGIFTGMQPGLTPTQMGGITPGETSGYTQLYGGPAPPPGGTPIVTVPPAAVAAPSATAPPSTAAPGPQSSVVPGIGGQQSPTVAAAQAPTTWGGRIGSALSALNPIGSAQAAETPPAGGAGAAAPAASAASAAPTAATPQAAPSEPQQGVGPVPTPAKVAPQQEGQAQQSERTPYPLSPHIDPGPWQELQRRDPQLAQLVQQQLQRYGGGQVTPEQVAAQMKVESDFNRNVPNSKDGAQGLMQVLRTTADGMHIEGDLHDPATNIQAGITYLRQLSETYGAGSVQTHYAYMRGDQGASRAAADWAAERKNQPDAYAALKKLFPNANLEDQRLFVGGTNHGSAYNAHDLINAGNQGGPEQLIQVIAATGPAGLPMSQRWYSAQAAVEAMAIRHGNLQALPAISEWFAQMSHEGALANLVNAHQMLSAGNAQGAAGALARAHAFFPDGSYATFGVDTKGQIWAQQISEKSGEKLGKPFQITPQAIEQQMIAMHSPQNYLDTLMKYRAANAQIDLRSSESQYYRERPDQQREVAQIRAEGQAGLQQERERNAAERQAEREKNAAAQKAISDEYSREKEIKTDTDNYYGPKSDAYQNATTPEARRELGRTADVFSALRHGTAMSPNNADYLARKIASGEATLKAGKNEKGEAGYAVSEGGNVLGYLPGTLGEQILGIAGSGRIKSEGRPQAMGIGAGSGSQLAAMQGLNTNLAGVPTAPMQALQQPATTPRVAA